MDIKPVIYQSQAEAPQGLKVVEAYQGALRELFFVNNPHLKKNTPDAKEPLEKFLAEAKVPEVWIHYPSENVLVHTLNEQDYFKLRTSRNRDVITTEEQTKYREAVVGIAGLSVGSAIFSALVVSGGPKKIKIADFDDVEISNLNRINAKLTDVGLNKTDIAAREAWKLDPYSDFEIWDKGVGKENIEKFLLEPRLDVFIDEMDSIDVKIISRLIARQHKLPVLMATDNGNSVILDVERFDLEPEREIFHGLIGDFKMEDAENLDYRSWLQLATKIVGPEYLTESMQRSLMKIGKEIPAVPQLGTTAAIAGTAMSFVVRRIANGEEMPSGRYTMGAEEKFIPGYNEPAQVELRKQQTKDFLSNFGKR